MNRLAPLPTVLPLFAAALALLARQWRPVQRVISVAR